MKKLSHADVMAIRIRTRYLEDLDIMIAAFGEEIGKKKMEGWIPPRDLITPAYDHTPRDVTKTDETIEEIVLERDKQRLEKKGYKSMQRSEIPKRFRRDASYILVYGDDYVKIKSELVRTSQLAMESLKKRAQELGGNAVWMEDIGGDNPLLDKGKYQAHGNLYKKK